MIPWTIAHQAALSMEFSQARILDGLPFLTPGDLPNSGIEPPSPVSPALAGRFFTIASPGKPQKIGKCRKLASLSLTLESWLTSGSTPPVMGSCVPDTVLSTGDSMWIKQTKSLLSWSVYFWWGEAASTTTQQVNIQCTCVLRGKVLINQGSVMESPGFGAVILQRGSWGNLF